MPNLFRRCAPLLVLVAAAAAPGTAQQTVRVRVEENFRKAPNGEVLARLEPGAVLAVVGERERWVQVDLEGWVWMRSLQVDRREGLDLVVSAAEGENLRDEPSGRIVARLERGTLLAELERRPGWIRVRRRGWVWAGSVEGAEAAAAGSGSSGAAGAPGDALPASAIVEVGRGGAAVLASPDGDTLALAREGTEVSVVARQGSWARVRLEGWAWLPPGSPAAAAAAEAEASGEPLTPALLQADPEAHRGRVVTWRLQFISLEEAERIRTDFFEGEPFLLTRYGATDGPFVYVAVPPDRLGEVEGLVPLEAIEVTGRVRTGRSALTGTPIIDLLTFRRNGGGG